MSDVTFEPLPYHHHSVKSSMAACLGDGRSGHVNMPHGPLSSWRSAAASR